MQIAPPRRDQHAVSTEQASNAQTAVNVGSAIVLSETTNRCEVAHQGNKTNRDDGNNGLLKSVISGGESPENRANIKEGSDADADQSQQKLAVMADTIPTATVTEMFQQLMSKINTVQTSLSSEIRELRSDKEVKEAKMVKIEEEQVEINRKVDSIRGQNGYMDIKMEKISQAMVRQNHIIKELQDKIELIEKGKLRPKLVVHGLVEKKGENCVQVVKSFLQSTMEITKAIEIRRAFRLGKGKYRPMQFVLNDEDDKGLIYSNAKKLQEKTNELKKSYRLEDVLPAKQTAAQRKQRNMAWRNKHRTPVADRLKLNFQKGKLMVEGELYKEQLIVPEPEKLLNLKPDEVLALQNQNIRRGIPQIHDTSKFIGFVADVSNIEEANKAYEWVRYNNMNARHVMAAVKLAGVDNILNCDYADDNEHAGGRTIMDYMDETEIEGRAIYVARYYDGKHIGSKRFECIVDAAKSAMNQKPYNEVTGRFQFSWSKKAVREEATVGENDAWQNSSTNQELWQREPTEETVEKFFTGKSASNWADCDLTSTSPPPLMNANSSERLSSQPQ